MYFKEISETLDISVNTVRNYIKSGVKCGKVNYNPIEDGNSQKGIHATKKIVCLTNSIVYNSLTAASLEIGISSSHISNSCKTGRNAGKINKIPLKWMYYEDYIKQQEQNQAV